MARATLWAKKVAAAAEAEALAVVVWVPELEVELVMKLAVEEVQVEASVSVPAEGARRRVHDTAMRHSAMLGVSVAASPFPKEWHPPPL